MLVLRSTVVDVETIARGHGVREYARLVERFGGRNWRKCKGTADVEADGVCGRAEVRWYECTGIGRVK